MHQRLPYRIGHTFPAHFLYRYHLDIVPPDQVFFFFFIIAQCDKDNVLRLDHGVGLCNPFDLVP